MKNVFATLLVGLLFAAPACAQNNKEFEKYKAQRTREFNNYRDAQRKKFEEFRRKRNEEYAAFVRRKWQPFDAHPVIPKPKDDEVKPVVRPQQDTTPPKTKPVPLDEVITVPQPKPQPKPVEPIEEVPPTTPVKPTQPAAPTVTFTYFGTEGKVRVDKSRMFRLTKVSENAVADAWLKLSGAAYTNLVHDCLKIREEAALCDWAYFLMLQSMAYAVCGNNTNEATLLMAYVYCQSGYKMRLGHADGRLYVLYSSEHFIYEHPFIMIDGEKYYMHNKKGGKLNICNVKYPKERSMSLYIPREQKFAESEDAPMEYRSKRFPDTGVKTTVNKNLLAFYNTYPTSALGENHVSRWAMYANTPLSTSVKRQIYPGLKTAIKDCDQLTAANKLLNLIQTGFEYRFDDQIWGCDRAFFAEDTLHYPYCDCEDRSILYSRLVRDLLGLDVLLVFYPGHLATAVRFTNEVKGDYITVNGNRYTVCDPTFIGASIGQTMPDMDNKSAKVIVLEAQ